ncbi:hypothetical protein C488_17838 [Natrinema pellirubrum DSM 15624]|uniref:Uncharacterized protein n=1 Tax=Natrinema pellirubrum (strain DSM 15624 / CIP 106293 / JCM 10476 / NCIMB 786 / 157) TaxID=797303 RepID=L0JPJ6_NATP1|nr:hypothetical protein [Natrinema pellirubrum]AGB33440.1 hypothetical protein Natpe_3676 [Natrinema pellirubrum DSM 15624]ELY71130.1 hypothetical protein C488_17838 [Natrinema pellirubrum DSM 15624]
MSVERGPTQPAVDEPTRITHRNRSVRADPRRCRPPVESIDQTASCELPLSARIERTRLRLRIAALERLVARSETRRQAVIDRYERVLADRDDSTQDAAASSSSSLLAQLRSL